LLNNYQLSTTLTIDSESKQQNDKNMSKIQLLLMKSQTSHCPMQCSAECDSRPACSRRHQPPPTVDVANYRPTTPTPPRSHQHRHVAHSVTPARSRIPPTTNRPEKTQQRKSHGGSYETTEGLGFKAKNAPGYVMQPILANATKMLDRATKPPT